MSPASRGRRAVNTLLSPSLVSFGVLVPGAASMARSSGNSGASAPPAAPAAMRAAPMQVVRPAAAPAVQPPAIRPPQGQAHQGGRFHGIGQGRHHGHAGHRPQLPWQPDGSTFRPSPELPATFRPSATWPQRRFHRYPHHGDGIAVFSGPQVIYAPDGAAELPLHYTHGETPLHYSRDEPCAATLIIRINGGPQHAGQSGVRVVHARDGGCGAPQVVNYAGPRVVSLQPAQAAAVPSARAGKPAAVGAITPAKRAKKGFAVVRSRY